MEVSTGRGSVAVLGECSDTFCVLVGFVDRKSSWLSHLCSFGLGTELLDMLIWDDSWEYGLLFDGSGLHG